MRALVAVWWALTELPVVTKVYPLADAWRLQLVSQPVWLLLVGVGAEGLSRLVPGVASRVAAEALDLVEERAAWARFGL